MRRGLSLTLLMILAALVSVSSLWAQGMQTGVVTGTVTSADGATVPNATVTVKSPSLQGVRTAKTDEQGAFILKRWYSTPSRRRPRSISLRGSVWPCVDFLDELSSIAGFLAWKVRIVRCNC